MDDGMAEVLPYIFSHCHDLLSELWQSGLLVLLSLEESDYLCCCLWRNRTIELLPDESLSQDVH